MTLDGIEVHDANKPCVLHIRTADANSGTKDPATCAAAKAACRVEGVSEARIYRTRSYLLVTDKRSKQKQWRRFETPVSLRSEIIAFDRGGTFDPGDYTLKPVSDNQRIGSKPKGAASGPRKSKRPTPHIVRGIRPRSPVNPKE